MTFRLQIKAENNFQIQNLVLEKFLGFSKDHTFSLSLYEKDLMSASPPHQNKTKQINSFAI